MTTAVVLGVGLDDRKQLCLCSLDCDAKRMWPPISKSGGTEADPGTDSAIYIQTLIVFWAPTCILFSVNAFGELKSSTHTHTYTHTETSSTPLKPKKFTMGATHNHTCTHMHILTACVFEAVDGVGEEPYTAQKASALLLVDFLMVPHANSDGVQLPDVSVQTRNTALNHTC